MGQFNFITMRMVPQVIEYCARMISTISSDPPDHFDQGMICGEGIGKLLLISAADIEITAIKLLASHGVIQKLIPGQSAGRSVWARENEPRQANLFR